MATVNQLVRRPRSPKTYKSASPALQNCPQRRRQGGLTASELETLSSSSSAASFAEATVGSDEGAE